PTICSGWRRSARASPAAYATARRPAATPAPWPPRSSLWRPPPGPSPARRAPDQASVAEDVHPGPDPTVVDDLNPIPAARRRRDGTHRVVVPRPILADPASALIVHHHVDI